jgi:hypothetical protein
MNPAQQQALQDHEYTFLYDYKTLSKVQYSCGVAHINVRPTYAGILAQVAYDRIVFSSPFLHLYSHFGVAYLWDEFGLFVGWASCPYLIL